MRDGDNIDAGLAEHAGLVDMEGYAVAAAAAEHGVPVRMIKHVSDEADDTAFQTWAESVAAKPRISDLPWLPQAEALGWSADGRSLYATGEFIPAPLYRIAP